MARKSEKRSIFYNLVKDEVTLTQAFCNFLRMECLKDVFINLVNEKRVDKLNSRQVKFEDFETEMELVRKNEEEYGRADLVLNYEGKEYLFEVKIEPNTTLTENQPESYLEYLGGDYKRLYFILPRNYYHKNELYNRMRINNTKLAEEVVDNQILYWEDIAKEIKRIAANGANPLLQEFYDILWKQWIGYEIVKFTEREIDLILSKGGVEMCNTTIPKIVSKLFKIVNNVKEKEKAKILSRDDFQSDDNFGYVLNNKEYMVDQNIKIFFGVEFGIWQEKSNCPLVVEVYTEEPKIIKKLEAFANQKRFDEYRYGNGETEVVWYKCINISKEECKNAFQEGEIIRRFEELLFKEVVEEVRKEFPRVESE